jgi:FMN phosphatase YigB (HAD superfamily)
MKALSLFLGFLLLPFMLLAEVKQTGKIEKIRKHIDQETLVIFDIDETLVVGRHNLYSPGPTCQAYKKRILNELSRKQENMAQLYSQVLLQTRFDCVEDGTASLVSELHSKGIKTLALTARHTGEHGLIKDLTEWTSDHLQKLQLDFSRSFPEVTPFELTGRKGRAKPLYKNGIIYTCSQDKGSLLMQFLNKINFHPKKVVFIDDLLVNAESVSQALERVGIKNYCYHYTYVRDLPDTFDARLADVQVKHLIQTGKLLSDEEARLLLPND